MNNIQSENIVSLDSSLASLKNQFNSGKEKLRFLARQYLTVPNEMVF
jgi:hypothetical protein